MSRLFSSLFRFLGVALLAAAVIIPGGKLHAQTDAELPPVTPPQPIQDNSFLVEEAYNQEAGVVQHISTFTRLWASKGWAYTFTQEWPVPGRPRHQLSYTAAVTSAGAFPGSGPGAGDSLFNYRYQVLGSGESRVAFAPRATLIAPTGSAGAGRGYGGLGFQVNLPLSVVAGKQFVTHWNLGATLIPNARNAAGARASTTAYNAGQSIVWLAKPRFNVLLETVWTGTEAVITRGQTQRSHTLLVSPGIRWAHNLANGLQIVPGIAVPMGVGPSRGERGVIVYLSFEHPWRRLYGTR
ncbi:MAG TPA: hypothetical protein VF840_10845 [Terriglobales bacterium]